MVYAEGPDMSDLNKDWSKTAGRSDPGDKVHRNGSSGTEHTPSHKAHYRPPTHLTRDPT